MRISECVHVAAGRASLALAQRGPRTAFPGHCHDGPPVAARDTRDVKESGMIRKGWQPPPQRYVLF
jgi:hypothetical protein